MRHLSDHLCATVVWGSVENCRIAAWKMRNNRTIPLFSFRVSGQKTLSTFEPEFSQFTASIANCIVRHSCKSRHFSFTTLVHYIMLPCALFVALSQSFAQIGVWAKVQRRLSLLVLHIQVSAISGQEQGDRRAAFFVCALGTQAHQKLERNENNTTDINYQR